MRSFVRLLFFFLLSVYVNLTFAQKEAGSDTTKLDAIIVTGQYQAQSLKKSVYQVRVIDREQIRLQGATNVLQVLSNQPGFKVSNDNVLGMADVKLNGMGGNNVKILLDGIPLDDRYDQRVSLSQIDVNQIQQIEIVEGPMSVLYGSDAMAGVINIITKKGAKNEMSLTVGANEETAGTEYYPLNYHGVHRQNIDFNYNRHHFIAAIGGTHNEFDGLGGDQYGRGKTWKPKDQWMGHTRLGFVTDHFNIYYRLDAIKENIVSRNPINWNNYKAIDQEYISHRFLHQIQSNYSINSKMQLNSFLAFSNYQRRTKTTRHNFETNSIEPNQAGEDDKSVLNSIAFKSTLNYKLSSAVSFQPGIEFNHEKVSGARIQGSPVINNYDVFLSSEIEPASFLKIKPGARLSTNSQNKSTVLVPAINIISRLNNVFTLRLAYGRGFKTPTLRELYLTFYDANHNLIGNPDLKAENANSFNGSITYQSPASGAAAFKSSLTGFYNAYTNQIQLLQSLSNPTEYTYYNIDKSKTTGGSIENQLILGKTEISLAFTYTGFESDQFNDKEYIKEDNRNYLWSPEITSGIIYNLSNLKTKVALFYKFIGSEPTFNFGTIDSKDAIVLSKISSYNLADFTVTTEISKPFTIYLGVKNIFNVQNVDNRTIAAQNAIADVAPLSIRYGRSYSIGLTFRWSKKTDGNSKIQNH